LLSLVPLLAWGREPARLSIGAGMLGVLDNDRTLAFAADYRFAASGLFQPEVLASWATDGSRFAGAGLLLNLDLDDRWRLTLGSAPGYYERNRGRDLGSSIEFHSTVELSYDVGHRRRLALSFGHTSNGGLRSDHNPGTETLMLSWSIPLGEK
jgi:hypothetical protein